ncbi:MAG: hypothetical protein WCJ64_05040, partial [Rhodospirillaceae bacterium]
NPTEANAALSDMMEMRILPKLNGVDLDESDNKAAVRNISSLVSSLLMNEPLGTAITETMKASPTFLWTGPTVR